MSSYSNLPEEIIKSQNSRTDISLEAMVPDHTHDLDEKRQLIESGGVARRSEAIKINGKTEVICAAIVFVGLPAFPV